MLKAIWKFVIGILLIGLPIFIYLAFIADDPLFEPEYDIELGRQVVGSLKEDTVENPVLSPEDYPEAYAYLQSLVRELTSSPEIQYRDLFKYDSVQIIHRDDILNAFCSPGGYIYVYTGLINYLDNKDHLAGVLGHEIAHAEKRHSAVRMQKEFGKEKIMQFLILATPASLGTVIRAQMLEKLLSLDHSRDQEAEADQFSVHYLQTTQFACNGTAGFFEKLLNEGNDVDIPEFLSDHPDSRSRVIEINKEAERLGCSTQLADQSDWVAFQNMMPKSESDSTNTDASELDTEEE